MSQKLLQEYFLEVDEVQAEKESEAYEDMLDYEYEFECCLDELYDSEKEIVGILSGGVFIYAK